MNSLSSKKILLGIGSLLAIAGAALSIYVRQTRPSLNETLHLAVANVMAAETAKLLPARGKVLLITMDSAKTPELKVQVEEFERSLQRLGQFSISKKPLETEGKAKYTTGAGLSGRRFVRALKNHPDAQVVVSFVGAPTLSEDELSELGSLQLPKFVAEVRSPDKLKKLFDKRIIQVAIVSRFEFPAPGPRKPRTPEDWFQNRFQIIRPENAASLPDSKAE